MMGWIDAVPHAGRRFRDIHIRPNLSRLRLSAELTDCGCVSGRENGEESIVRVLRRQRRSHLESLATRYLERCLGGQNVAADLGESRRVLHVGAVGDGQEPLGEWESCAGLVVSSSMVSIM
jgi:hypothetical protein